MPRINHNVPAMLSHGALVNTEHFLGKSLERLSTGLRINRASDDAAGLSISENLRTQIRGLNMAVRNSSDAMNVLMIAEGAANEVSSILQRMRELAVQAASDTNANTERVYLNQEFEALIFEISRITQATTFNRQGLLDGSSVWASGATIQVAANNQPGIDQVQIVIDPISSPSLGLSQILLGNEVGIVKLDSQSNATIAISSIDLAISSINTMRADMGTFINRLEHSVNNIRNQHQNTVAAESIIRDIDMAEEMVELTKNQILQQSGTAMLAQANQVPQNVLSLFQ